MAVTFGKFELVQKLASGGMGELYLARAGGRAYALKRLHPHFAGDARLLDLLLKEARVGSLLVHPNLVPILELDRVGDDWYVLMEHVEGKNLQQLWEELHRRRRPFPLAAACQVAIDAARGLHHAHRVRDAKGAPLGFVHRDVCLANVMLSSSGEVKVIDFGVAKVGQDPEPEAGVMYGHLGYLAPEQAEGAEVDPRADQFGLGVVLWELLTGRRLFAADTPMATLQKTLEGRVAAPSQLRPDVDAAVDAVVLRALARQPEARFEDMGAFAEALEDAAPDARASRDELAQLVQSLFGQLGAPASPAARASAAEVAAPPASALEPHQEEALRQLSAFRGGFSVDAAEAVVDLSALPGAPAVLDVLDALSRAGLLKEEPARGVDGEVRLVLARPPAASPEATAARRHLDYFAREATVQVADLEGEGRERALAWLQLERGNLEVALERARAVADGAATRAVSAALSAS